MQRVSEGAEPNSSDSVKLTWREGEPPPEWITSSLGAAVAHGETVCISRCCNVYSYSAAANKWTTLRPCRLRYFSLAVVRDQLTTIGGQEAETVDYSNTLLRLSGDRWEEVLPPMPTGRQLPGAATTPTHLVVAGGRAVSAAHRYFRICDLSTVEVMDIETLQWSVARTLPQSAGYPRITVCDRQFYISDGNNDFIYSCSVANLLTSCKPPPTNSSDGGSVWTRLADIPVEHSSLVTLKGCVLAVGGGDERREDEFRTEAIHSYDAVTNSWSVISEMPTSRYDALTAVLPSNELVVVGGEYGALTTEIGTIHSTTGVP